MAVPGKIAMVTGAGSGIGEHGALALMRDGYAVVLAGRRREPLEDTAANVQFMTVMATKMPFVGRG